MATFIALITAEHEVEQSYSNDFVGGTFERTSTRLLQASDIAWAKGEVEEIIKSEYNPARIYQQKKVSQVTIVEVPGALQVNLQEIYLRIDEKRTAELKKEQARYEADRAKAAAKKRAKKALTEKETYEKLKAKYEGQAEFGADEDKK